MKKPSWINSTVIVVALGYFVDIFDLTLFNMVRVNSLKSLGVMEKDLVDVGVLLLNSQMAGMLLGGLFWGVFGDRKGRLGVLFGSIIIYSLANILNAFVQDIPQYVILRFISGLGLAGELGAGITLIAEILPKEIRGMGTALVAAIGVFGAVLGGIIVELTPWRWTYVIGGLLGLMLVLLRMKVIDSDLFLQKKKNHTEAQWGSLKYLFSDFARVKKFMYCIGIGLPIWFVAGLLMAFSPELAQAVGVQDPITASRTIGISYLGLGIGDFMSGYISQIFRSRKKTIQIFKALCFAVVCLILFSTAGRGEYYYYTLCFLVGLAAGYWAIFVTTAAEQFGTNLRATVATSVPNFVRGAVIPMTLLFKSLKGGMGIMPAMAIVGLVAFGIATLSAYLLPESFHKDLDYVE
ncbi:MAG TPA: MFS transporter [Pseudobdellovibrionaceae bacterium]|jgi:predicted MFS family arabinose efflux permease